MTKHADLWERLRGLKSLRSFEGRPLRYSPGMRAESENKENPVGKFQSGPVAQGATGQLLWATGGRLTAEVRAWAHQDVTTASGGQVLLPETRSSVGEWKDHRIF